jgi:hypothetical protein
MGFSSDDDDDNDYGNDVAELPSAAHPAEQTHSMTVQYGAINFRPLKSASHPVERRCAMEPQTALQLRYVGS